MPERLRFLVQEASGAAVKLGQMMSTHSDLVPTKYCRVLSRLVDQMEGFPYAQVERIFEEDLGERPTEFFDHFDPDPIAAGSIGQVHRAALRGRLLAVKVRRPSVPSDFAVDLVLLNATAELADRLGWRSLSWLVTPIREFIQWTAEELDFSNEGRNQEIFAKGADEDSGRSVPRVYPALSTPRILTMDWLEGRTVMELLRRREAGVETPDLSAELARHLVRGFFQDAFNEGRFHGDLHPANLLVLSGNRVGYIDFGITGHLDRRSRWHLMAMTAAHATSDAQGVASSFFELATGEDGCDHDGFVRNLTRLQDRWSQSLREGSRPSMTRVMMDLLQLSRQFGIWPRRNVVRYIRSVVVLDGLVKSLTAEFDIQEEIASLGSNLLDRRLMPPMAVARPVEPTQRPSSRPSPAEEELATVRRVLWLFGFGSTATGTSAVESVAGDRFTALWETEGRGYRLAAAAEDIEEGMERMLEKVEAADGPSPEHAALHVGASLAVARSLLASSLASELPSLNQALQRFHALCEQRHPPGCSGLAWEALGLVVRTLCPGRLAAVDSYLRRSPWRGHYWHGVGRALYFLYPRAVFARNPTWPAGRALEEEVPDAIVRSDGLAGLAFPLTLIHLRSPCVLESYLHDYRDAIIHEPAFVNGMTNALLLWLHWAGPDEHFHRLWKHQTAAGANNIATRWNLSVGRACEEAICAWETGPDEGGFTHLFRYSPSEPPAA